MFFTGPIPAEGFIQKGNPVVPVALKVNVKDLPPGALPSDVAGGGRSRKQSPQPDRGFRSAIIVHRDLR